MLLHCVSSLQRYQKMLLVFWKDWQEIQILWHQAEAITSTKLSRWGDLSSFFFIFSLRISKFTISSKNLTKPSAWTWRLLGKHEISWENKPYWSLHSNTLLVARKYFYTYFWNSLISLELVNLARFCCKSKILEYLLIYLSNIGLFHYLMSVLQKTLPSTVTIHYHAW